jgi:type I restriction enzyme, S subunit
VSPAVWERSRLKYVADCNRHVLSESTSDDHTFKYVDISAVGQGTMDIPDDTTRFGDAPSRARRLAEPGDTVISTVRTYLRAVATVPETDEKLVLSTGFAVLHPRADVSRRFLAYVLQGDEFVDKVVANSVGVSYPAITATDLMSLDLLLPHVDEQRAIADYLDHETAQIDALVAKQGEFIGLLRERRDTVVRLAITERTGEFPVDKLGRSAKVGNGSTPRRDVDRYWRDGDVPWLTSAAVNLPEVTTADQLVTDAAVRECHLPMVEPGDLLIGLIGQGPTRGMATISRVRATLSQNLAYIAPDQSKWKSEYLLWALRASYREIRQRGAESGAAQGMLNTDDIRRIRVAMPPISEQSRIVSRLDDETSRIDALIAKAEEHIALARERRSALITAAVTGQIDVPTARKAS